MAIQVAFMNGPPDMEPRIVLILTTVPNLESAERIARVLVESGLAACVNIVPGVRSIYRWQGVVETAEEVQLVIKTSAGRYRVIEETIRSNHPHELPEIVVVPVADGLPAYLRWVAEESRGPDGATYA